MMKILIVCTVPYQRLSGFSMLVSCLILTFSPSKCCTLRDLWIIFCILNACLIIQDTEKWPLIDPLPSYGRGRERPGQRYISFIHGDGLTDVVITGEVCSEITLVFAAIRFVLLLKMRRIHLELLMRFLGKNGTIDGQGEPWWEMWRDGTLKFTRPNLIEFKNSSNIVVSHVVLQNSPFWTLHPVYCRLTISHFVCISWT